MVVAAARFLRGNIKGGRNMKRSALSMKAGALLVVIGWCLSPSPCRGCSSFAVENRGFTIFGTNYDNTIIGATLRNHAMLSFDNPFKMRHCEGWHP